MTSCSSRSVRIMSSIYHGTMIRRASWGNLIPASRTIHLCDWIRAGREIELPDAGQGFRGVARHHHVSPRSLQRSLKIERNERLLLDDEDGVSIETDAFHGCAVPSRADTLRPSSRLHHDVFHRSVTGLGERVHERHVLHLPAPFPPPRTDPARMTSLIGHPGCSAYCTASRVPYF